MGLRASGSVVATSLCWRERLCCLSRGRLRGCEFTAHALVIYATFCCIIVENLTDARRYAGRYADPITDYGFKKLFADVDLLLAFINVVLAGADRVTEVVHVSTEVIGDGVATRTVIYDLRCRTADGRTIIVEVQRLPQPYFKERTLYYAMRSFAEQVRPGAEVYELRPVYVVVLLDYDLPGAPGPLAAEAPAVIRATGASGYDGFLHRFRLSSETGELFSDVLQLYFLELNKLSVATEAIDERPTTMDLLEQWGHVLSNMTAMDRIPDWVTDEDIRRAFTVMEVAQMSPEERDNWERALAQDRDLRGAVLQQYIFGKAEGREEGRAAARAQTRATAERLLARGMPHAEAAEVLGMSPGDLDELLS